ncbi:MAG TPA: TonB-dependent receptor, partial [Gemmatimonadaceae bacterium]|nr:TonB-dependent receptor [Gemmatimonadaceae bacterium]
MKKFPISSAAALLALTPAIALAQQSDNAPAKKQPAYAAGPAAAAAKPQERDTVPTLIYSVNRTPDRPFETARAVTVISNDDIRRRNVRSLSEVLAEAGVWHQATAVAGSEVASVRGMEGKQLLMMIDGVQLNNAVARYNINQIDLNMIERIEIVRGVGSVLGSEALGGIINIITKRGPANGESGLAHVLARSHYSTSSPSAGGYTELYGQGSKFRYVLGGTYTKYNDMTSGGDIGQVANTGYHDKAANASVDYFLSPDRTLSASFHGHELADVPRADRLSEGTFAEFLESPSRSNLGEIRYSDLTDRGWSNRVQATTYFHRMDENQSRITAAVPGVRQRFISTSDHAGVNLELGSFFGDSHQLVYGIDLTTETVHSTRRDSTFSSGAVVQKRGRYTDGATYQTYAAYVQDRFAIGKRWEPTVGVRYAGFTSAGYDSSSLGAWDIGRTNRALTASLHNLIKVNGSVHLAANMTSGFRAPSLDEMAVFDIRGAQAQIPNANLKPERITTYEAGIKVARSRASGSLFYNYSRLTDVMRRVIGTYQGKTYLDVNNNNVKDPGELNIVQAQNLGSSVIQGPELDVQLHVLPTVALTGNAQLSIGEDTKNHQWLFRTPPAFGTTTLRWTPAARTYRPWGSVVYHFASAQHRLSPEDIADWRIGADGTPAFNALSVRGGGSFF